MDGPPHSRKQYTPWGTTHRTTRGAPHSPTNCTPWGTPQRTTRGARLRRATPSSGTKAIRRAGNDPLSALIHCLCAQEGVERARIAPLPDELHSLGYPAICVLRGTERVASPARG